MNEDYVKLFFEKKRDLVCETCGKELNQEEAGKHAMKEKHYGFKLKEQICACWFCNGKV